MFADMGDLHIKDIYRVVDHIQSPIFIIEVIGLNLVFRKLNTHYESAVGILSSDIENKTAYEFLPARVADTVENNYRNCVSRKSAYEYEELLTLNNEERWWSTTLSPILDETGEVRYVIGVANDITELKRSNIAFTKEISTIKRQNDDINTLTAIAAHDLRPAISNVRAFADLILEGFKDLGDGKVDKLNTIRQITDIMSDYVERVLAHARSINIQKAEASIFAIDHIVRDITAASDPDSAFEISHPSGLMKGEEVVFQIILRNLIENATRFAQSSIRVEVTDNPENPDHLLLSISDDGEGFPGGVRGFEKCVQTDDGTHVHTSGFGLRAVRQLAETRDGQFWLGTPQVEGGTTFCVSLPGTLIRAHAATPVHRIDTGDAAFIPAASAA